MPFLDLTLFHNMKKVTPSITALTDLNIEFCTGMEVDLDMRLCWLSIDCWCLALRRSFCSLRSFRVEANNPPKPLELLLSPRLDGGASLPVSSSTPETNNHVLKILETSKLQISMIHVANNNHVSKILTKLQISIIHVASKIYFKQKLTGVFK